MDRSRRGLRKFARSWVIVLTAGLGAGVMALPLACSSNDPVAAGGTCFETTDCANGFVCIYKDGTGTCSNDLSSIQQTEDGSDGTDGAGGGGGGWWGGGGGGGGGGGTDSGGGGTDSGSKPDTSTPPVDSGSTVDSGAD